MAYEPKAEEVRKILTYRPKSGEFRWRVRVAQNVSIGDKAGHWTREILRSGKMRERLMIRIKGKSYLAHRLAWLYMTGRWPKDQIDHRDGNPKNNRWSNLRECTPSQNQQNKLTRGYYYCEGRWRARIGIDGMSISLGSFKEEKQAHEAYLLGCKQYHNLDFIQRKVNCK